MSVSLRSGKALFESEGVRSLISSLYPKLAEFSGAGHRICSNFWRLSVCTKTFMSRFKQLAQDSATLGFWSLVFLTAACAQTRPPSALYQPYSQKIESSGSGPEYLHLECARSFETDACIPGVNWATIPKYIGLPVGTSVFSQWGHPLRREWGMQQFVVQQYLSQTDLKR
jgi:hypothetical protein